MRRKVQRWGPVKLLVLATMTGTAGLAAMTNPAVADPSASAYSGDAYGIGLFGVKVASLVTVSDTKLNEVGPFNAATPQSGDSGLVNINFTSSLLTAKADTARSTVTEGSSASSASSALQTADVNVGLTSLIRARVLTANTAANCSGAQARSQVLSVSVAGVSVNANVSPNTTITVKQPLTGRTIASVTINRQSTSTSATHNAASADALVVSFPANGALAGLLQGTVVIAHAESDVTCAAAPTPPTATVSVGYVDNEFPNQPSFFPTPWEGDPRVVFVGTNCSRGTRDTCDDGAIKVDNTSTAAESARVTVDIGSNHYDLWGTQTIPAGGTLILTQTAPFNFDTSETNPSDCTTRVATVPVVNLTLNGVTTSYNDTGQVLNTKGMDTRPCPNAMNEGQPWQVIP